jgi:hypothetical protein
VNISLSCAAKLSACASLPHAAGRNILGKPTKGNMTGNILQLIQGPADMHMLCSHRSSPALCYPQVPVELHASFALQKGCHIQIFCNHSDAGPPSSSSRTVLMVFSSCSVIMGVPACPQEDLSALWMATINNFRRDLHHITFLLACAALWL